MSNNISAGVYSKIIDLSEYVQQVPGTIGYINALTKKGRDNQLIFISSKSDLIKEWGEPNITDYGKYYGQGLYCACNFLSESGSLFFMRCLPDDATYANIVLSATKSEEFDNPTVTVSYNSSFNSISEIKTSLEKTDDNIYPLCIFYPVGRGEYYNNIGIKITAHANPMLNGIYILDIYEIQSDGSELIVESFEVSFDPTAMDQSGDSIWIGYVLEQYSSILRMEMSLTNGNYSSGYDYLVKTFDKNIGDISVNTTDGTASIIDTKQDFSPWAAVDSTAEYMIIAKDGFGNKIYGWLGEPSEENDSIDVYNSKNISTGENNWSGDVELFKTESNITYEVKKSDVLISTVFSASPLPLKRGSDGNIVNEDGSFNSENGTDVLQKAFSGLLVNPITGNKEDVMYDIDTVYFNLVFDCGYPSDVKTQILNLVKARKDCVAIIDNGDNSSLSNSISARNDQSFNNYLCAIYDIYSKINDQFTGQDIWVSPVYHMSYILPRNDRVSDLWYAPAGFNRASIDSIKELRYVPKLGDRDQLYLKQINPIVKFGTNYVVWSQLTSQTKASALQDLNITRLVLYIKRALEIYTNNYIFEQNDQITWSATSDEVCSFLEDIKRKRGLYSYSVEVGATEYERKTKTYHVNVILEPTRTTEKILLNFYIK